VAGYKLDYWLQIQVGVRIFPVQHVSEVLSPGVKQPEHEAENSTPFSTEVKNV
jgi:hypothetical protein